MKVRQDTLTAILLFAASVISIPITAGMSGVYCISIPVGLMLAAFACCEDGTEDKKNEKDDSRVNNINVKIMVFSSKEEKEMRRMKDTRPSGN